MSADGSAERASSHYELIVEHEDDGRPPDTLIRRVLSRFRGSDHEISGVRIFELVERSTRRTVLRQIEAWEPDHEHLYDMIERDLVTMSRNEFEQRWDSERSR